MYTIRFLPCFLWLASIVCAQPPAQLPPVEVTRAIQAEVNTGLRVVGSVQPKRLTTIGSAVDGRVLQFFVNQGDTVQENQALAQIRTGTLEIELAAAQAEFELHKQVLAELENGSRAEDVAEAHANMMSAKSSQEIADKRLARIRSLSDSRAVSASEVDTAEQQATAARFALSATEALLNRIKQGARKETIAQANARVELQRQRVRLLEDRITKCTIRSPFDGFVAAEFTEVGAWISQGDPIAQVIQLDEVEIQAPVTAEKAVQLSLGDTVRVEFPELPNKLFTGSVDRIVPMADARTRTFPIHVRMKNETNSGVPLLMAGMLARVHLPAGRREMLPLVPKDALVLNGVERCVFVVDVDEGAASRENVDRVGTVRKVPIDLGVALEGLIQIRGELAAGELVVVVGNERLVPGAKIRISREIQPPTIKSLQSK